MPALLLAGGVACGDRADAEPPDFELVPGPLAMPEGRTGEFSIRWLGRAPSYARVQWSVAPPSLGTVDALGLFTARAAGTGVYAATVRTPAGTATRSATLSVFPRDCGAAMQVSSLTASIAVGGQVRVRGTVLRPPGCDRRDSADVSYRSLDPAIARVDSLGLVTGWSAGVTRIEVASRLQPAVAGTVFVTVLDAGPPISALVPQPSSVALGPGDTVRVRVVVHVRAEVPDGVRFASRDTVVATVDGGGLVRGVRPGATEVVVRAEADSSVFVAVPVTVRTP